MIKVLCSVNFSFLTKMEALKADAAQSFSPRLAAADMVKNC
jgi:hypothetical protein